MSTVLPNLIVHTDGASRSNPGHSTCAFLVSLDGKDHFKTHKQYLGDKVTNNQAEYSGMALALAYLVELITTSPVGCFADITVYSDSKFVVEQVIGAWKVRDADLRTLWQECQEHLRGLRDGSHKVVLPWIPRERNSRADQHCNQALDEAV